MAAFVIFQGLALLFVFGLTRYKRLTTINNSNKVVDKVYLDQYKDLLQ